MTHAPTLSVTRANRMRTVSVPKAVAAFLVAGLVVLAAVGVVLVLALRQNATAQAILDSRMLTKLEATAVVGPVLRNEALVPGPSYDALDRVVRQLVLGRQVVRVKIWDATGRVVYSDDASLVGKRFPLPSDELAVLNTGGDSAEVSDLSSSENMGEKSFGKLLQVYLGVRTPTGQRLLFETYQPYQVITESSRRAWLTSLPVLLGGLFLLYLVQAHLHTAWPADSSAARTSANRCCWPPWPRPTGNGQPLPPTFTTGSSKALPARPIR